MGKSEGRRPLGKPRRRLEDNIKMNESYRSEMGGQKNRCSEFHTEHVNTLCARNRELINV